MLFDKVKNPLRNANSNVFRRFIFHVQILSQGHREHKVSQKHLNCFSRSYGLVGEGTRLRTRTRFAQSQSKPGNLFLRTLNPTPRSPLLRLRNPIRKIVPRSLVGRQVFRKNLDALRLNRRTKRIANKFRTLYACTFCSLVNFII